MLDKLCFDGHVECQDDLHKAVKFLSLIKTEKGQRAQPDLVLATYDPKFGQIDDIFKLIATGHEN